MTIATIGTMSALLWYWREMVRFYDTRGDGQSVGRYRTHHVRRQRWQTAPKSVLSAQRVRTEACSITRGESSPCGSSPNAGSAQLRLEHRGNLPVATDRDQMHTIERSGVTYPSHEFDG
jgi:hypothetical protein